MSITSQLPAPIPFISIREVLEGLAAEKQLPFEAVAKFILDRVDSLPQAITCGMTLEYEAVPKESVESLLNSAVLFSIIGFPYDPEVEKDGPFEHDYDLGGWNRDELAAWLRANGISAAICNGQKPKEPASDDTPPEPAEQPLPSEPVPEIIRRFAACDDSMLMTIGDACLVSRLSRATINRRIDDGSLEKVKISGAVRIPVGSLRKMMSIK